MNDTVTTEVIIVGAGLAGLTAARLLTAAGVAVVVVEKSRGLGGRLATRREGEATFDHGAQYFTVRDPGLAAWVSGWQEEAVARVWCDRLPEDPPARREERWVGQSGMTAIAKRLAEGLTIHRGVTVTAARWDGSRWQVETKEGPSWSAPRLLLTAPVPQSLALLAAGDFARLGDPAYAPLHQVEYLRAFALLATLAGPSGLPAPGAQRLAAPSPLRWIADNAAKGVSAVPAITAHSSHEHAVAFWDAPDDAKAGPLLADLAPRLDSAITSWKIHRWRYAQPVGSLPEPCFADPAHGLWLAGDAFPGGRVEGAYLSGKAAADCLLASVP